MEIYGFQNNTYLDSCRVGSNSIPTVSLNQLIMSSFNAPLNVLQDHRSDFLTSVYLQPDLFQNDRHCRIPPFRWKWHRGVDLARSQEAPQVGRQKGGLGRCIKVPEDVFFHQFLDLLGVATDQSHLVSYSYSLSNWGSWNLTCRAVGLCLVAVLSLAWQTPVAHNPMSKVDVVLVGGITLLTTVIVLSRIYCVFSLMRY